LYLAFLSAIWRLVFLLVLVAYLSVNSVFASLYLWAGGIENARPHSFADAFFFSVQTIATIGYGKMSPISLPAHLLVTVESFCGIVSVAMITGLMFAKFARPSARVLWSEVAVIAAMYGKRSGMCRGGSVRWSREVVADRRV